MIPEQGDHERALEVDVEIPARRRHEACMTEACLSY
jgi:hypothetical protein